MRLVYVMALFDFLLFLSGFSEDFEYNELHTCIRSNHPEVELGEAITVLALYHFMVPVNCYQMKFTRQLVT